MHRALSPYIYYLSTNDIVSRNTIHSNHQSFFEKTHEFFSYNYHYRSISEKDSAFLSSAMPLKAII